MKLINYTLLFLTVILFLTIGLWAILFYSQFLKQVKSSIDEGLSDYKIVIIDNLKNEEVIKENINFGENKYLIKNIKEENALKIRDSYRDTLIYSPLKDLEFEARLLTTAFVADNGKYYKLEVISQELNRGKLIRKFLLSLFWMFLFLLLSTVLLNNFVLKKTWKPFHQILNHLNDFRLDKKIPRGKLVDTKIREFALLNDSVKNLTGTNIEIFNSQKHFMENVSHEMQTPLAIGIHKLELLVEGGDLTEEQLFKVGDIIETLKRLSGLNKSLLLLSKIKNKQFISEEEIDFDGIVIETINDLSEFIDFWDIQLKYQKVDNWVHIMNRDLAQILVLNLLKNAITHNKKGGELFIRMTSSSFSIENSGSMSSIPEDQLFKRFKKDSKNKNSTGLGLSIVKAIVDNSGLSINYSFGNKHVFTIKKQHN